LVITILVFGAMAKAPEKEIDLVPDAWQRFERAVKVVAKSPPQHRKAKKKSKPSKSSKAQRTSRG
jgi:hypothetical protein